MRTCSDCGCEFDLSDARRIIGRRFGSGSYDEYIPDADLCEDCARELIGSFEASGDDLNDLMGDSSWNDD